MTTTDPGNTNGKPQRDANNPDEAMDTPEKVEESNDMNIDEDFPGYPHYPAEEDILDPENSDKRVNIDVENLTRSHNITPDHIKNIEGIPEVGIDLTVAPEDEPDDIEIVSASDSDLTAEDFLILGGRDDNRDMGADEALREQGYFPRTAKDLDEPDPDEDGDEIPGNEDEENSYYSLGGDEMEKLDENNYPNN